MAEKKTKKEKTEETKDVLKQSLENTEDIEADNQSKPKRRARTFRCVKCGNIYSSEVKQVWGSRNYCPDCFVLAKKASESRGILENLIREILSLEGKEDDFGYWAKVIMLKINQNEFTLEGVIYTIEYMRMMDLWKEFSYGNLYYPIKRNYGAAKRYYASVREIRKKYDGAAIQAIKDKPVTQITVNRSDLIKKDERFLEAQKTVVYGPAIDLDDIEDEE